MSGHCNYWCKPCGKWFLAKDDSFCYRCCELFTLDCPVCRSVERSKLGCCSGCKRVVCNRHSWSHAYFKDGEEETARFCLTNDGTIDKCRKKFINVAAQGNFYLFDVTWFDNDCSHIVIKEFATAQLIQAERDKSNSELSASILKAERDKLDSDAEKRAAASAKKRKTRSQTKQ